MFSQVHQHPHVLPLSLPNLLLAGVCASIPSSHYSFLLHPTPAKCTLSYLCKDRTVVTAHRKAAAGTTAAATTVATLVSVVHLGSSVWRFLIVFFPRGRKSCGSNLAFRFVGLGHRLQSFSPLLSPPSLSLSLSLARKHARTHNQTPSLSLSCVYPRRALFLSLTCASFNK